MLANDLGCCLHSSLARLVDGGDEAIEHKSAVVADAIAVGDRRDQSEAAVASERSGAPVAQHRPSPDSASRRSDNDASVISAPALAAAAG